MKRRGIACAAVAALMVIVMPSPPAWAGPDSSNVPGGYATWEELFEVQNRMNRAAESIQAAARNLTKSGFASAVAAPEARELVIYWSGPVPQAIEAVVRRERKLIPISVKPAPYAEHELLAEVERLGRSPAVLEAGPLLDGRGLFVRLRPAFAGLQVSALSRIPVQYRESAGGHAPFSRKNDAQPWSAGGWNIFRQWYPYGGGCTTGFAVWHGGVTKLLSAAHCGPDGSPFWDGNSDFIGYAQAGNTSRDVQLINARGSGRTWDGGVISSVSKAVKGASQSQNLNWLCTSGSRSGVRCNIQVKQTNVSFGGVYPLVKAERVDQTAAAGTRDSGGPVFELQMNPDNGNVIAKGIINSGDTGTQVACAGENFAGRICTWRFYYADVVQTLQHFGASIVIG
jgi:hypothetical protein